MPGGPIDLGQGTAEKSCDRPDIFTVCILVFAQGNQMQARKNIESAGLIHVVLRRHCSDVVCRVVREAAVQLVHEVGGRRHSLESGDGVEHAAEIVELWEPMERIPEGIVEFRLAPATML